MSKIHKNLEPEIICALPSYRERLEAVKSRIDLLDEHDRLLVKMHLDNGNSFHQISRLTGISGTTVSRRITRITKRLLSKDFSEALINRKNLTETQMKIAQDYFIRGLSIKALRAKYKMTFYKTQKQVSLLKSLRENKKRLSADVK